MKILNAVKSEGSEVFEPGEIIGYKGEANGLTFYLSAIAGAFYTRFERNGVEYEITLETIDSGEGAEIIASRIADYTKTEKTDREIIEFVREVASEYKLDFAYDPESEEDKAEAKRRLKEFRDTFRSNRGF